MNANALFTTQRLTYLQRRNQHFASFQSKSFLGAEFLVEKLFESRGPNEPSQNQASLLIRQPQSVRSLELLLDPIHFDGVVDEGILAADVVAVSRFQPVDDLAERKHFCTTADVGGGGEAVEGGRRER